MRNPFRKSAGKRTVKGRIRKTRFRRDYALFLAPIGLALLLLAGVTQNAEVLAAAWRDPAVVLEQRSPGERAPGALYSTKPDRVLAQVLPTERVLPVVRERFTPEDPVTEDFSFADPAVTAFAPEIVDNPPLPTTPPVLLVNTLPNSPPPPTTTPGAVPEPTTWMISILGLFAVAGAMRRRNRKVLDEAIAAAA